MYIIPVLVEANKGKFLHASVLNATRGQFQAPS